MCKAWIVAVSVGAVEALKDQGFCRWSYVFRSLTQHAKTRLVLASQSQPHKLSGIVSTYWLRDERAKKTEETLTKVMHLSSWGPH